MDLLSTLQADLRNISIEAKKKHTDVKEEVERALLRLRAIQTDRRTSVNPTAVISLIRSSDMISPLLLACNQARSGPIGAKLFSIGLGAIQKLLSHNIFVTDEKYRVLDMIRSQVGTKKTRNPSFLFFLSLRYLFFFKF